MGNDRIVADPEIKGGQPCIKGTRIAVVTILEEMACGYTVERLLEAYPHITREDVEACFDFAAKLVGKYWEVALRNNP